MIMRSVLILLAIAIIALASAEPLLMTLDEAEAEIAEIDELNKTMWNMYNVTSCEYLTIHIDEVITLERLSKLGDRFENATVRHLDNGNVRFMATLDLQTNQEFERRAIGRRDLPIIVILIIILAVMIVYGFAMAFI